MVDHPTPSLRVTFGAGAGYKALCVIKHNVQVYLLTKGSTYKWDTCAPHAILRAQGGGLCDYKQAMKCIQSLRAQQQNTDHILHQIHNQCQVSYHVGDELTNESESYNNKCCNSGGIIAYVDKRCLLTIMEKMSS